MAKLTIKRLDNAVLGTTFTPCDDRVGWVAGVISRHFDCDEDDIGECEDEEGDQFITIKGEPVARLVSDYGLIGSF